MAKAKEINGLECDAPAGDGLRLVLLSRLDEMIAYRDAALDFTSDKGVHDMRVASRRLRSALRDFAPYLSKKRIEDAKDELRRVARALGAVRDEDVGIGALEKLSEDAPEELKSGVEGFAEKRRGRRERARAALAGEISAADLARLREEFSRALEHALRAKASGRRGGGDDGDGASHAHTFRQAGREIIIARWEEFAGLSGSLYEPFDTERLHDMRIAGKRLRYAVELFTPCLGGDALKPFCEGIADMQTSLGELHDCDEWILVLGGWLDKKSAAGASGGRKQQSGADASPETDARARRRDAAFWMLGHFVRERTSHYRETLGRWREWERTDFAARLRAALDEHARAPEPAPTEQEHPPAPSEEVRVPASPEEQHPTASTGQPPTVSPEQPPAPPESPAPTEQSAPSESPAGDAPAPGAEHDNVAARTEA